MDRSETGSGSAIVGMVEAVSTRIRRYAGSSLVYQSLSRTYRSLRSVDRAIRRSTHRVLTSTASTVEDARETSTVVRIAGTVTAPIAAVVRTIAGWTLRSGTYRWLTGQHKERDRSAGRETAEVPEEDWLTRAVLTSTAVTWLARWILRLRAWGRSSRAVQQAMRVDEISIRALSFVLVILLSIRIVAAVSLDGTAVQIGLLGLLLVGALLGYWQPWRDEPV